MRIKESLDKIVEKINNFKFMTGAFIVGRIADISSTLLVVNNYGIGAEKSSQTTEYMQRYGTLLGNILTEIIPEPPFLNSVPLLIGGAYLVNKYYNNSSQNKLLRNFGNKAVLLPVTLASFGIAISNIIVYLQYSGVIK